MKRPAVLPFVILVSLSVCSGQQPSAQGASPKSAPAERMEASQTTPQVYEDDEIKLGIPAGWRIVSDEEIDHPAPGVIPSARTNIGAHPWVGSYLACGSYITQVRSKLLLSKDGYTLAMAYHTNHATNFSHFGGIIRVPWLEDACDEADDCASSLAQAPLPVNRTLMFINLYVGWRDPRVLERCRIPEAAHNRWFAGYFTTNGDWTFNSEGSDCGIKAYTLTSNAETPDKLPSSHGYPPDPKLSRIIREAIGIVDSIHYKRCPPKAEQ